MICTFTIYSGRNASSNLGILRLVQWRWNWGKTEVICKGYVAKKLVEVDDGCFK